MLRDRQRHITLLEPLLLTFSTVLTGWYHDDHGN
ncbi:hypothetical protein CY0110_18862 [Crocosphaera chwakensis CCY0110]|uniref:Uncharacterized protein n=1 Tax=Crocosphaera chwakensis CCY0110 TaxID=391612 RepID=A3IJA4_9CHRO|nr:hypothetical protein CY0110_18862 [Crocosphaera chwakensis CCY0110]